MWELWLKIFSVSGGLGIAAELGNVGFEPVSFVVMLSLFAVLVGGYFWCKHQGLKCFLAFYDEQRELEKELELKFSDDGKKVHLVKENAFGNAKRSPGLDPFEAEAYE